MEARQKSIFLVPLRVTRRREASAETQREEERHRHTQTRTSPLAKIMKTTSVLREGRVVGEAGSKEEEVVEEREEEEAEKGENIQVKRGYNIIEDGWAGA